jgi:hypothetical protein
LISAAGISRSADGHGAAEADAEAVGRVAPPFSASGALEGDFLVR